MNPDVEPAVVGREVEVVANAQRRRFPAQYKLRILREAEKCTRPGELGALLLVVHPGGIVPTVDDQGSGEGMDRLVDSLDHIHDLKKLLPA